jgi:ATP-binding cassette subfamily F protein 3
MIIYSLDKVSKYWGASVVLDKVSWDIQEHGRIGLVGPNGAGKSTLFKIISGEYESDGGFISKKRDLTIGYMEQEPKPDPRHTILEEVHSGAGAELRQIEHDMKALEVQMAEPDVYEDERKLARALDQHARLVEAFEQKGGLNFEKRVEATLRGLGFEDADFGLSCSALSGGQKKLVGLAKLLVSQPDLLLLDEPDNHLDLKGKAFLEQFINDYPGTVVIISHDRYLLDVVAEDIVEVEDHGLVVWSNCNYSEFAYTKKMALLRQQQMFELQQKEIARLEMSVRRLLGWAGGQNEKFVRRARSMEKRLDKIERIDKPILERKTMGLEFNVNGRGSNKVLEIKRLGKRFDGEYILRDLDLMLWQGERVGLVGPNGAGKSVLFRTVLGQEPPTHGEVKLGPSNVTGYYAQEHETLNYNVTLMDEVRALRPMSEREAAGLLGRFLFGFEKGKQKVSSLSGGEKARLQMLKLMMGSYNFLLLDEPTNNLDIASAEVLEDALDDYKGTVLIISHDRYFLDRIVNRIVELEDGKLKEYLGNYTYYKEQKDKEAAARKGNGKSGEIWGNMGTLGEIRATKSKAEELEGNRQTKGNNGDRGNKGNAVRTSQGSKRQAGERAKGRR